MLLRWGMLFLLMALSIGMVGCAAEQPSAALGAPSPSATPPSILAVAERAAPTVVAGPPTAAAMPTIAPQPTATTTPSVTPSPGPTSTPTPLPPLIAIDPGHGGADCGAVHQDARGRVDVVESEVVLDLALRLRALLLAKGYRVILTRDGDYALHNTDEDVNGDGWVNHLDEAQMRLDRVNAAAADVLLSLHLNAYVGKGAEDVSGTLTLYCADRPFAERNQRLAELVHQQVLDAFDDMGYASRDRGIQDDKALETPGSSGEHIVMLGPQTERIARPSLAPGALSEPLFLTNDREAGLAANSAALDRLAQAYAEALAAYLRQYPDPWESP